MKSIFGERRKIRVWVTSLIMLLTVVFTFLCLNFFNLSQSFKLLSEIQYEVLKNQSDLDRSITRQIDFVLFFVDQYFLALPSKRVHASRGLFLRSADDEVADQYKRLSAALHELERETPGITDRHSIHKMYQALRILNMAYHQFSFGLDRLNNLISLNRFERAEAQMGVVKVEIGRLLARRDAWRYKSEKLRQDFLGEMLERRKNYQIYFLINIIFQMFLLITLFWNDRLARRLRHSRTTEKKQGALLARYEARVRSLPARLIDVQEKERVKIGRLVHDEIGHLLTAIKIHLHLIRKKLATSQPAIDELIVEASSTIDQTNELLKGILEEIRPVFLDRFGFSEAIKLQVGKFSLVSKLPCTVVINVDNEKDISKSIATGMFRIVQESLTNVLKHADAEKVVVRVDRRNENLVLRVFDDGTGIRNEDLEKKESFGILGMQERIYFFNGKFKIGSLRHIKGTFLKAVVPITGEMECV